MTTDTQDNKQDNANGANERIGKYIEQLNRLKERKSFREVLERELLLFFIQTNSSRINEFPLLKSLQNSIVNMLCYRESIHPAHQEIKRLTSNFAHLLTQYSKDNIVIEEEVRERLRVSLINTETLLLKGVQGVVLATSLVHDNFEETIIRYFGEQSVSQIEDITENTELGSNYWKALINQFITPKVEEGVVESLANEKYSIITEGGRLLVQFQLDEVLSRLNKTSKEIQKTRVQENFANTVTGEDALALVRLLFKQVLTEGKMFKKGTSREELFLFARLTEMDNASSQFKEKIKELPKLQRAAELNPEEKKELAAIEFVRQQINMLAAGSAIGMDIIRQDFEEALEDLVATERTAICSALGTFDISSIDRAFHLIIESKFMNMLRKRVADEGTKIIVRSLRHRAAPDAKVTALEEKGLTKIRKNKIWEAHKGAQNLRFKPRSKDELDAMIKTLLVEDELAKSIFALWDYPSQNVEIVVSINLEIISKTTTNLKLRLTEIFTKLGISRAH